MIRIFFAMRWQNGALTPMLYHDEFKPTKEERATMRYACELPQAWHGKSLIELAADYHQRAADGTLPPSILRGEVMSGPFQCSTCDGTGQVITGWDADGEETLRACYECKGTGETWFFITDPNRPKGWPGEPPAMNLQGIVQQAIARQQGHTPNRKDP